MPFTRNLYNYNTTLALNLLSEAIDNSRPKVIVTSAIVKLYYNN